MILLLHGEDDFLRGQALRQYRAALGDAASATMNSVLLEGDSLSLAHLVEACNSLPFLGEARLVVVRGLSQRLEGKRRKKGSSTEEFRARLAEYLPQVPPTTRLILDEDRTLDDDHPLIELVEEAGGEVRTFGPPEGAALVRWIISEVKSRGGVIESEAAEELAAFVGSDLRALDREIEKLLAYADGRPIRTEDIHLLVSQAQETNVFAMVDALGEGDLPTASRELRALLETGQPPLQLLAMIVRQYRLLIQVKELSEDGLSLGQIAARLRTAPFVVRKIAAQTRRFSMDQLIAAYHRLVEADEAIKTGRLEPALALDLLVAELAEAT